MRRDPLMLWWRGRDISRDDGEYLLSVALLPARSLMARADLGRPILTGLHIEIRLRAPMTRDWWKASGDIRWRSPVVITIRSDASEIATRRARAMGWESLA